MFYYHCCSYDFHSLTEAHAALDCIPKGFQPMIMKNKGFRIIYRRVPILSLPITRHSVTRAEHLLHAGCASSPPSFCVVTWVTADTEVNAT